MERRKLPSQTTPAYPDLRAFVKRHARRAGIGLMVGLTASAGCDWFKAGQLSPKPDVDTGDTYREIDGMIGETGEVWTAQLPIHGSRSLAFADPSGSIGYHVTLTTDAAALYDWLMENAEEALTAVDAVLLEAPLTRYAEDDGFAEVEDAIARALAGAYQRATGTAHATFLSIELAIDSYQEEEAVPGDTEAPG